MSGLWKCGVALVLIFPIVLQMLIIQVFHQFLESLRVEIEIPLEVSYSSNMLLHLVKNVFHKAFPIQYY